MSREEKAELEAQLEEQFQVFYAEHGSRSFLEPDWAIILTAKHGLQITRGLAESEELARVAFQSLLSIRSLLAIGLPHIGVTRDILPKLATEATRELSQQINRKAAELSGETGSAQELRSDRIRRDD